MPVTEEQWTAEHKTYEGCEEYKTPRPVTVMWYDPSETPSEAIIRLNNEVLEYAAKAGEYLSELEMLRSKIALMRKMLNS